MIDGHGIQSLAFRVQAVDEPSAFTLRSELRACWNSLLPEFERCFDEMASGDTFVHIPRLILNIRVNEAKNLSSDLPGLLRQSLRDISQQDGVVLPGGAGHRPDWVGRVLPDSFETRSSEGGRDPIAGESGSGALPGMIDSMEILRSYLAEGRVPWYARIAEGDFESFRSLASDRLPSLAAWCAGRASAHAWFRLLTLLPAKPVRTFVVALSESMNGTMESGSGKVASLLEFLMEDPQLDFSRHQRTWLTATVLHSAGVAEPRQQSTTQWRLDPSLCLSPAQWSGLVNSLSSTENEKEQFARLCTPLRQAVATPAPSQLQAVSAPFLAASSTDEPTTRAAETVRHAGAVLLHAHLPTLFSARGIETVDGRIPQKLMARAAALLCFLVCGKEDELEFRLDIIKVLLGLAPDWPLPLGGGLLDEQDKVEAGRLLGSMLGHWSALKGTTAEGMQRTFLQRPGLLRQTAEAEILKIERTGADILLDRFPYPFTVVKLPWMPRPIYVEW